MSPINRNWVLDFIEEAEIKKTSTSSFFCLGRFAAIVQEEFDLRRPPSAEWCRETLRLAGSMRETGRVDVWEYREYPSRLPEFLRSW